MTERLGPPLNQPPESPEMEVVVVAEMPVDQLYEKTGNTDPVTGAPLTRLDELRQQEAEQHGGRILTQIGDRLSDGAKATNRALHNKYAKRTFGAGAFVMAVVAVRAVKKHIDSDGS